MPLLLGVDLGTSYFKVGVFDETGETRGLARIAVEVSDGAPGRAELSVEVFWEALRRGVAEALAEAKAGASDIAGLSYSSQANTFVLVDAVDRPLTPLILWTDQRAEGGDDACLNFADTAEFARTAGFRGMSPLWAVAKWRWLQRWQPEIWARCSRAMTLSDYFTWSLTGDAVGDSGTAAFLGLLDLGRGDWWPRALQAFGIDAARLSQPLRPGSPVGNLSGSGGRRLGLRPGIAFAVGGLDHQVAALGSGLGRLADASISTGTVLAAVRLVAHAEPTPGCYHGPDFHPGEFYRLAFNADGAGKLDRFVRHHAPHAGIGELIALALGSASVTDSRTAPSVAPAVLRDLRELLVGIADSQRELIERIAGSTPLRRIVATGGGARSEAWLQLKADRFGIPIVTPASSERACLGAAMVASVAAGVWPSLTEASAAMIRPRCELFPRGRF
jgi:xylulokinase